LIAGEPHEIDRAVCSLRLHRQHPVPHARITRVGDSRPARILPIFSTSYLTSRSVRKEICRRIGKTVAAYLMRERIAFRYRSQLFHKHLHRNFDDKREKNLAE